MALKVEKDELDSSLNGDTKHIFEIKPEIFEAGDELLSHPSHDNEIAGSSNQSDCAIRNVNTSLVQKKNDLRSIFPRQRASKGLISENGDGNKATETDDSSCPDNIRLSNLDMDVAHNDAFALTREHSSSEQVNSQKRIQCENLKESSGAGIAEKVEKKEELFCKLCSFKTKHIEELNEHDIVHKEGHFSMCEQNIPNLKKYASTRTRQKPFCCGSCFYKTIHQQNLTLHMVTHMVEKPFLCKACSFQTNSKSQLKKHILSHNEERPFSCDLCSYKATLKQTLTLHLLTHAGDKPFYCELCSFKTKWKYYLKKHTLIHMGEKPFSCDLCSFKAAQKTALKEHITATHTSEKPFSCDSCSYKTSYSRCLKAHRFTHTGEKPFACDYCPFKAARKTTLQDHTTIHTGEKPVLCKICPYKTNRITHLNRHILLRHIGKNAS